MKLSAALFIAFLFLFLPGSAFAGGICDFDKKFIPERLKIESERIENLSTPLNRDRQWQEAPVLARPLAREMLTSAWRAFGYRAKPLQRRVNLNMLQIKADSNFRPHLQGLFPGQVGPALAGEDHLPGGLFAFANNQSYLDWSHFSGWRGDESRFNPLSNIVAAVAAQVGSGTLFSGKQRIEVTKNDWLCLATRDRLPSLIN